jgi:hypothetical protein
VNCRRAGGAGAWRPRLPLCLLSQNISSSIEAFYDENGLWEWIFWQNIPLTLLMMGLICLGMRREPPDLARLRR